MNFANPNMLWMLALTLPLLSFFLFWAWRRKQQALGKFVQSRLLSQLTVGVSKRRQQFKLALLVVAVAFVILALARPRCASVALHASACSSPREWL